MVPHFLEGLRKFRINLSQNIRSPNGYFLSPLEVGGYFFFDQRQNPSFDECGIQFGRGRADKTFENVLL
jgi:hypothetical protein